MDSLNIVYLSFIFIYFGIKPIIFAGLPTTIAPFGIVFKTRLLAPTLTSSSILILPKIVTLAPRNTLSPNFGCLSNSVELPVPPSVIP